MSAPPTLLAQVEEVPTAAAPSADGRDMAVALADGTVLVFGAGRPGIAAQARAHNGAVLDMAAAPAGGWLAGGDDGRLSHIAPDGSATTVARCDAWLERVAVAPTGGLVAVTAGKAVRVFDRPGPQHSGAPLAVREFDRTAADVAFDPKGRRLAIAHYGGVTLDWARPVEAQRRLLERAGPVQRVTWSPDGRCVVAGLQEPGLHGWRLRDGATMVMRGYDAKVKSVAWAGKGRYLATSGLESVVFWPFTGKQGPMDQEPVQAGGGDGARVAAVAARPRGGDVVAGYSDGSLRQVPASAGSAGTVLQPATGDPVEALALTPKGDGCLAATEDGALSWLDLRGGG